jgi:quercetin dioxygenase-like cupin family protein
MLSDEGLDYVPLAMPEAEGVSFKVLKADAENRRVVAKVKFAPNSKMPRHTHHCRAIAYTLSGEWEYDKGRFTPGVVAYESVGENHQPFSKTGTEMFLIFDADGERFLENHLSDGTTIHLGMRFFKAMERITRADAEKLDLAKLVDIVPAK